MTKLLRFPSVVILIAVSLLGSARRAHAQGFGGPGGMGSIGGRHGGPAPKAAPPKSNEPVTHAASGASDENMRIGGTSPLSRPIRSRSRPKFKSRSGPTPIASARSVGSPRPSARSSLLTTPRRAATTASRRSSRCGPSANSRAIALALRAYYNRRSTKHDADVLFPLFWHLRDDSSYTTIVGPFVHQEAPHRACQLAGPALLQRLSARRRVPAHPPS